MPEERARLPRDVWALSITSFFADCGYEMVLPIVPFFLAFSLFATPFLVGAVDGTAQFAQSVLSAVSGDRWAHRADRRRTGTLGYLTTGIAHALLALTVSWPQVLLGRVTAWLGRGARQPVKSAIVANATPPGLQGRAFGLEQALDSAGAVAGTAIAVLVLLWLGPGAGAVPTPAFRTIFWLSAIPSAGAVVLIGWVVRDRARATSPDERSGGSRPAALPIAFRWFLAAEAIFGLGSFSILLALLRVGENLLPASGGSLLAAVVAALLLYLLYNVIYTLVSYPSGQFADRRPGLWLVGLSFVLFAGVDLALLFTGGLLGGILAFVVAGVQVGIQGVAESAWVARAIEPTAVGRAYGRLGSVQGLTILAGSLLVGGLWTYTTPTLAFATSAVLCLAGAAALWPAARRLPLRAEPPARALG